MKLSFVIPCYRSENTISNVVDELEHKMSERPDFDYEIVAVNDQSPDSLWSVLKRLCEHHKRLKAVNLAKNGGKPIAQIAGFHYATGDIIICLDDDGQCPIDRLWDLIEPLNHGYDIAIAAYPVKKQSLIKNIGSNVNRKLSEILDGKKKGIVFSNFIARKRFVCDEIIKFHNPRTKLDSLTLRITNNIAMVEMEEREREVGKSGYTFRKSFKLLVDGCLAYSIVPMRLAYLLSAINGIVACVMFVVLIVEAVLQKAVLPWFILLSIFVSTMVVLFCVGLVGDYIARFYTSNNVPQYVVHDLINIEEE